MKFSSLSFSVGHGNSLAIVGRNGAGKSTLLNIATGLCAPSHGNVEVNGRIAALRQLGSGFHQDLTGAEKVRINASSLGLGRREVRQRVDDIVEFAEIGEFIDEPLRTYLNFSESASTGSWNSATRGRQFSAFRTRCRRWRCCAIKQRLDHGQILKTGPVRHLIGAYAEATQGYVAANLENRARPLS